MLQRQQKMPSIGSLFVAFTTFWNSLAHLLACLQWLTYVSKVLSYLFRKIKGEKKQKTTTWCLWKRNVEIEGHSSGADSASASVCRGPATWEPESELSGAHSWRERQVQLAHVVPAWQRQCRALLGQETEHHLIGGP